MHVETQKGEVQFFEVEVQDRARTRATGRERDALADRRRMLADGGERRGGSAGRLRPGGGREDPADADPARKPSRGRLRGGRPGGGGGRGGGVRGQSPRHDYGCEQRYTTHT